MCRDDTPMVRRNAAENISVLSEKMIPLLVKQDLLSMWMILIGDEIDSVKVKTVEATLSVA